MNSNATRRAIITRADESVQDWIQLTHPILKEFARKWNAEFVVLDKNPDGLKLNRPWYWRILHARELLDHYDRISHLDTDIILNKNCPDLFDLVPEDKIGVVYEDKGSRKRNRRKRIKQIQKQFGSVGWKSGYLNAGVMIFSKVHSAIFESIDGRYWNAEDGPEQGHLGWQINKQRHAVLDLGYRFNHMSMFSESWNRGASRFDSHIIHYAGGGRFPDKGARSAVEVAHADKETIYGNRI